MTLISYRKPGVQWNWPIMHCRILCRLVAEFWFDIKRAFEWPVRCRNFAGYIGLFYLNRDATCCFAHLWLTKCSWNTTLRFWSGMHVHQSIAYPGPAASACTLQGTYTRSTHASRLCDSHLLQFTFVLPIFDAAFVVNKAVIWWVTSS